MYHQWTMYHSLRTSDLDNNSGVVLQAVRLQLITTLCAYYQHIYNYRIQPCVVKSKQLLLSLLIITTIISITRMYIHNGKKEDSVTDIN